MKRGHLSRTKTDSGVLFQEKQSLAKGLLAQSWSIQKQGWSSPSQRRSCQEREGLKAGEIQGAETGTEAGAENARGQNKATEREEQVSRAELPVCA